ncbi:MAG: class I SAM-dependent methyltransferase [Patescibacteria group bacterium]|jgi:2-polyprenyl-3-methyl-5-hydroxy-6-metoxy-1,4-benzoquinol methylase
MIENINPYPVGDQFNPMTFTYNFLQTGIVPERSLGTSMKKWIIKFCHKLPKNAKIIDVPCGGGETSELIDSLGYQVYPVDGSLAMINKVRGQASTRNTNYLNNIKQADIFDLPYADGEFDGLVCVETLSLGSTVQRKKVIQHLSRIIKPGGRIIIISAENPESFLEMNGEKTIIDETKIFETLQRERPTNYASEIKLTRETIRELMNENFIIDQTKRSTIPESRWQKGRHLIMVEGIKK